MSTSSSHLSSSAPLLWEGVLTSQAKLTAARGASETQKQETIKQHSWLEKGHPFGGIDFEFDPQLAFLINGDGHISGSKHEGYQTPKFLSFYVDYLAHMIAGIEEGKCIVSPESLERIKQFRTQMVQAAAVSNRLEQIKDEGRGQSPEERKQLIRTYAEELSQALSNGEMLWFPGGWINQNGGNHGMLIRVDPEEGIAIINTGDGVDNHPIIRKSVVDPITGTYVEKTQFQEFLRVGAVNRDRLHSPDFFQYLIELQVKPSWDRTLQVGEKHLYGGLVKYLQGKKEPGLNPQKHPEAYKRAQRSGTCVVKSGTTAFYYEMTGALVGDLTKGKEGRQDYKKCKFMMQSETLLKLCQLTFAKELVEVKFETLDFIQDFVDNLRRSVEKLHKQGQATPQLLLEAHATFKDIDGRIKEIRDAKKALARTPIERPLDFTAEGSPPTIVFLNPTRHTHSSSSTRSGMQSRETSAIAEVLEQLNRTSFRPLKTDTPQDTLSFLTHCTQSFSWLQPLESSESLTWPSPVNKRFMDQLGPLDKPEKTSVADALLGHLFTFFKQLPIPKKGDDDFWDALPQQDILPCMQQISQLQNLLANVLCLRAKRHPPAFSVMTYGLYSIMDTLARRLPETSLDGFETNGFDIVREMRSAHFVLEDQRLQKQLHAILLYFDPEFTLDQLHMQGDEKEEVSAQQKKLFGLFKIDDNSIVPFRAELTEASLESNPTFQYYRQFLDWENPRVAKHLQSYHLTQESPLLDQVAALMSEPKDVEDPSPLPQGAELLKKAALMSLSFLQEPKRRSYVSKEKQLNDTFDMRFSFRYEVTQASSPRIIRIIAVKNGSQIAYTLPPRGRNNERLVKRVHDVPLGIAIKCQKTQNRIMFERNTRASLKADLRTCLELDMIGVNPQEEVNRAIIFGMAHPELLKESNIQEALEAHFFRPLRLQTQLTDYPAYAHQLAKFVDHGMRYYLQFADVKTCMYLAYLGEMFKIYAEKAGIETDSVFPDYRKRVLENVLPFAETGEEKVAVFQTLMKFYQTDTISQLAEFDERIEHLIEDRILLKIFDRMTNGGGNSLVSARVKGVCRHFDPLIKMFLGGDPEQRNQVFDTLLKRFDPEAEISSWQGEGLVFENDTYILNIEEGILRSKEGGEVVTLPHFVTENQIFQRFCQGRIERVEKLSDNQYEVFPHRLVITILLHNEIQYSQEIEGKTHFYIETPESAKTLFPTIFKKTIDCWVADGDPSTLIGRDQGQITIRATLEKIERVLKVVTLRKHVQGEWMDMVSVPPPEGIWGLGNHENPKNIECFKLPGEEHLNQINLPLQGLHFSVRGAEEKRAYSNEYPGYWLSDEVSVPALNCGIKRIVLINAKGDKKILIPRIDLKRRPFTPGAFPYLTENSDKYWIDYSVSGDSLVSSTIEGKLYLAYIYAENAQYEEAFQTLLQVHPIYRLTPDQETIVEYFAKLLVGRGHPNAQALLLKLCARVEKNHLKYPLSVKAEAEYTPSIPLEIIESAYDTYMETIGNTTHFRLSDEEERLVIQTLYRSLKEEIEAAEKKGDSNKVSELKIRYKQLNAFFKKRKRYLKTGRAKLSITPLPLYKGETSFSRLSPETLIETFQAYSAYPIQSVPLLGNQEKIFYEYFFAFYHLAKEGTDEEKEQLSRRLDLAHHFTNKNVSSYVKILIEVLENPSKYPTRVELRSLFGKRREARQAIERISREISGKADRSARSRLNSAYRARDRAEKQVEDAFKKIIDSSLPSEMTPNKALLAAKKLFSGDSKEITVSGQSALSRAHWRTFQRKKRAVATESVTVPTSCGESLQQIDYSFDTFFQGMLTRYFTVEEKEGAVQGTRLVEEHKDPIVREKLRKENEELDSYRAESPPQITYHFTPGKSLFTLEESLTSGIVYWNNRLQAQKQMLLWQVNAVSLGEDAVLTSLHRGGIRQQVSWKELQQLFLEGNRETYRRKTTLSDEQIERLITGTADYLAAATRMHQMQTALMGIQAIHASETDEAVVAILQQNLGETLALSRHYAPSYSERNLLWFECANGYMYREIQLQKIREVLECQAPERIAQMPTGFGKTKNQTPTVNDLIADGETLPIDAFPSTLEVQNALDIQEQMEASFGRQIHRIAFDRTTHFSVEALKKLYHDMKKDIRKKRPLTVRTESLRALELHFIYTLYQLNQPAVSERKKLEKEAEYFIKILRLIRVRGSAVIDEVHKSMDPLDKLIYTIGDPIQIPHDHVDVIEELFEVLTKPPFDAVYQIQNNRQPHRDLEQVRAHLPALADHFADWLKIEDKYQESFKQFVLGELDTVPSWIEKHPKKEQIALVKGQLTHILPNSCNGYVNENFGLSRLHLASKEYAISYMGSNTPKETAATPSQFKNPHETLTKTYLTYLYQGLSSQQVRKMIHRLKEEMRVEQERNLSLDETRAVQHFKKMLPDFSKPLYKLTDDDIAHLAELLSHNKAAIFYYVRSIVVPQFKIYPQNLVSSVQNFRSMFAASLSYSATPPDVAAHGPNTHFIPMQGTSGQVTHLLLTKCASPESIHVVPSDAPSAVLEDTEAVMQTDSRIHSVIDVGAQFKGLSNTQIAERLRQGHTEDPNVLGVVFFDEQEQRFKVMDVAKGHVSTLEESTLFPRERSTYYDQNRSFGSDIKQAVDAIALLLAGKGLTKATAGQAAGRQRQLHKDQSIQWVVPQEISDEIFGKGVQANIMDLLIYFIANQAKDEATKNGQSQGQQMENEIRSALLDKILGLPIGAPPQERKEALRQKANVREATRFFGTFEPEFVSQDTCNAWLLYATIPKPRPSLECLTAHQRECTKRLKRYEQLSKKEKSIVLDALKHFSTQWEGMALPEEMLMPGKATMGMECEVLQEVEVEVEAQMETRVKEEFCKRSPWDWDPKTDLFSTNWMKPTPRMGGLERFVRKIHRGGLLLGRKIKEKLKRSNPSKAQGIGIIVGVLTGALTTLGLLGWGITALIIASIANPIMLTIGAAILAFAGVITGLFFLSRRFIRPRKVNTLYRLDTVMQTHLPKQMRKASKFFSEDLLVSNNFYTQRMKKLEEVEQKPFTQEQKPLFQVLVIEDEDKKGNKQLQLMLIDQNDSKFFGNKLREDREKALDVTERKRRIALYDLRGGIVSEGQNSFTPGELEANLEFQTLLTEAKVIGGEVNFTEQELEIIKKKTRRVGKKLMERFFLEHTLKHRPLHQKVFPHLPLAELFQTIA